MSNPVIAQYKRLSPTTFFKRSAGRIFDYLPMQKKFFFSSSGRGGLEKVLEILDMDSNSVALLPAFIAEGAIIPFKKREIIIKFYDLEPDLQIDLRKINTILKNNPQIRCLLVIHYFGFPQPIRKIREICDQRNVILIEDCAQALFSKDKDGILLGSFGHISFFSFSKTLSVPDGAIFFLNIPGSFKSPCFKKSLIGTLANLFHVITLFFNKFISKMNSKSIFFEPLNNFNKGFYNVYYKFLMLAAKPKKISVISKILLKKFNYSAMIENYKNNLEYFYNNIDKNKYNLLYYSYSKNYVYMSIPAVSENRDDLISSLRKKKIFCSFFFKKWDFVPEMEKEKYINSVSFLKKNFLIPINFNSQKEEIEILLEILNTI